MSFVCERAGCEDEPVGNSGKCVAHLREDLLARRAEKPDGEVKKPAEETGQCPDCGHKLTVNGKCMPCVGKATRAKKKAAKLIDKKASPSPQSPAKRERERERERKMNDKSADLINHPPHYTRGKIEVIDFIEDQGLGYHDGNVVKYICRHRHKGSPLDDLRKARWYLDRLIEREEAEHGA